MRASKVDKNQPEIVKALRSVGCHVTICSQLKNAFDLIVVYKGVVYIVEIKDGLLAKSAKKLTEGEAKCKESVELAGGVYNVIGSVDEAFEMILLKD